MQDRLPNNLFTDTSESSYSFKRVKARYLGTLRRVTFSIFHRNSQTE